MTDLRYDPRPIFEIIAQSLVEALQEKDWEKVQKVYEEIKKLSEKID